MYVPYIHTLLLCLVFSSSVSITFIHISLPLHFTLLNIFTMSPSDFSSKDSLPQVKLAPGPPEAEGLTLEPSLDANQLHVGDSVCVE